MKVTNQLSKLAARYPVDVVLLVAALVIGCFAVARLRGPDVVEAHIILEDDPVRAAAAGRKARPRAYYDVMQDPNYRTADRLRDASSVALLLGLRRIHVFAQKQPPPPSVTALLAGILPELQANGVTPAPDGSPGVLLGPGSTIYVRYRIAPFAVEVISIPHNNKSGDNIIVRLPADDNARDNSEANSVSIYTHSYVREVPLPAPFASRELIMATGWKAETLRQSSLTPEQVSQIVAALRRAR